MFSKENLPQRVNYSCYIKALMKPIAVQWFYRFKYVRFELFSFANNDHNRNIEVIYLGIRFLHVNCILCSEIKIEWLFNNLILVYCFCCCCYFVGYHKIKVRTIITNLSSFWKSYRYLLFVFVWVIRGSNQHSFAHMWVFFERSLIALWNLQTLFYFVMSMYLPYDLVSSLHCRLSLLGHSNLRNIRQVQRKRPLKQIILQIIKYDN